MKKNSLRIIAALTFFWASHLYAGMMGPATVQPWTGFYVGGTLGGERATATAPIMVEPAFLSGAIVGPFLQPFEVHPYTFVGGGQVGYNRQDNHLVLGGELNINAVSLNKSYTLARAVSPFVVDDHFSVKNTLQTSLLGRLGYAQDYWLFYGLGGISVAQVQFTANFISSVSGGITYPALFTVANNTLVGGTGGLGVEYALTDNWHLGVEGRYTGYVRKQYELGRLATFSLTANTFLLVPTFANLHLQTGELLFKVNYKFNSYSF